mgnify:CR=1 FL=1
MPTTSPLSKRIKRHVIGRPHLFFAATSPGFENSCHQELLNHLPDIRQASIIPGGVEFEGRLEDCFHANLHLHLPNRILMRINTFKATNFRQLEKKTIDMPWELYLHPQTRLKVHVTTRHCRLHHSSAIAERIERAVSERLADFTFELEIPGTTGGHQQIYMRGVDDHFSVSIDSSGDLLYKRGLKVHSGKAPLRETLAAGALMLAGYDGREPLLDPLCGSGTFSLEAALMAKHIPAGWFRDFAFTAWPSFIEKRWNYIRRQAESGIVQFQKPMIFASDTDRDACQKFERCIENYHLTDAVQVHQIDFFDLNPQELTDRIGTICINPPYGRRLGAKQDSEEFFHAIGIKLRQAYKGWKLALIAPNKKVVKMLPFQTQAIPVWHGGLKLRLLIGKIQ